MVMYTACIYVSASHFFTGFWGCFLSQTQTAETYMLRQRDFPEQSIIFPSLICTGIKQYVWKPGVQLLHSASLSHSVLPQVIFCFSDRVTFRYKAFQLTFSITRIPSLKAIIPAIN